MSTPGVRSFLAFAVVGVFMGITAFMAIFPLVTKAQVDLKDYSDFFAKTASVYTGIVGVVIGYYFGRPTDASPVTTSVAAAVPASTEAPPEAQGASSKS